MGTLTRHEFATIFSRLRRVTPRVPFWKLAAHRIPTLWTLYRGLLRVGLPQHVKWRIRMNFKMHRSCTSPVKSRDYLFRGYRWLDVFQRALKGDSYWQTVIARYDRMIALQRERNTWESIFRNEQLWIEKLRNRPIVTGAPMRPTLYNKPLPRLKPQPMHISGMIYNRRRTRFLRMEKQELLTTWRDDLRHEHAFETGLLQAGAEFDPVFAQLHEWMEPIDQQLRDINAAYERDKERAATPYSPELLALLKAARREKIRNKTHERARERRGEILPRTLRRMQGGPPAHILARMTPEQRERDRTLRMSGEGGYTGSIKRAAGMRMRGDDACRREGAAWDECTEIQCGTR